MRISEVKRYMLRFVAGYFGSDHVSFAEQKMTRLPVPYITVKFDSPRRHTFQIRRYDNTVGCWKYYWERRITMEVNLYTEGRNLAEDGEDPVYENTATQDLDDFIGYLLSEWATDELSGHGVAVQLDGDVHDISEFLNDNRYRYRAMVLLRVDFTDCTYGLYGQNQILSLPNPSGGGDPSMVQDEGNIETVEITEKEE